VHMEAPELVGELPFWREMHRRAAHAAPVVPRLVERPSLVRDAQILGFELPEAATAALCARRPGQADTLELLLAAWSLCCADHAGVGAGAGAGPLLVELKGHGREAMFAGVDVSRTAGWFASMFPLVLEPSPGQGEPPLARHIAGVQDSLRAVPHRGFGYGILRYLAKQHHAGDPSWQFLDDDVLAPRIGFNYLGDGDPGVAASGMEVLLSGLGATRAPDMKRLYDLELGIFILGRRLRVLIEYDETLSGASSVARLAAGFERRLVEIAAHCASKQEPSSPLERRSGEPAYREVG